MKITRDRLLALALEETERRAERGDVLSGYVIGSLAAGDPLLGGKGDIDLVLIHGDDPLVEREFMPISSQIHLDITHRPRSFYRQPRKLREHPWYGPEMCEPAFLYDPTHYFEWAQAAVRGQFHRPDFVYARACAFLRHARRSAAQARGDRGWLGTYLQSLLETINAAASLSGFPAAGRQVGPQLAARLSELGYTELYHRFQQLLGADRLEPRRLPDWIAAWARAYDRALEHQSSETEPSPNLTGENALADRTDGSLKRRLRTFGDGLAAERRAYYLAGFQTMVEDGRGPLILWPLLASWQRVAASNAPHTDSWEAVLKQLQLSRIYADRRLTQLERLQDQVEDQLERWSERVGA